MTLNSGGLSWNVLNLNSLLTLSFVHCSLQFWRISTIAHSRGTDALFSHHGIWEICQENGDEDVCVNRVSWSRIGSQKSSKYLALTVFLTRIFFSGRERRNLEVTLCYWIYFQLVLYNQRLQWTGSFWKLGRVYSTAVCSAVMLPVEVLEIRGGQEIRIH